MKKDTKKQLEQQHWVVGLAMDEWISFSTMYENERDTVTLHVRLSLNALKGFEIAFVAIVIGRHQF